MPYVGSVRTLSWSINIERQLYSQRVRLGTAKKTCVRRKRDTAADKCDDCQRQMKIVMLIAAHVVVSKVVAFLPLASFGVRRFNATFFRNKKGKRC